MERYFNFIFWSEIIAIIIAAVIIIFWIILGIIGYRREKQRNNK